MKFCISNLAWDIKDESKILNLLKNKIRFLEYSPSLLIKDINSKKEILEKQIDDEIKKIEQEIVSLKKNAPEKISKIAIETASELIRNLIGADVNQSSISAIVEDLLKKNRGKYHGN